MKTVIIYASVHHGNTKKVVDAIAAEANVDVIDATKVKEADLTEYDVIGLASGMFYNKFHQSLLRFAENNLPVGKKVFYISTSGGNPSYKSIDAIATEKKATVIGDFNCKGYDTYGPFKLVGGIAKGHPNQDDLKAAVEFYKGLDL